jgi:hypothetical protein
MHALYFYIYYCGSLALEHWCFYNKKHPTLLLMEELSKKKQYLEHVGVSFLPTKKHSTCSILALYIPYDSNGKGTPESDAQTNNSFYCFVCA